MTTTLPLTGIRILDLTRLLPGPFATMVLAQLGAEVIKIEDPDGGDYVRSMAPDVFSLVNRGKKSVALDLRDRASAAAFRELAKEADVVVESFRPGVMDKLGCGPGALRELQPKLVYVSLTGYGHTGPYRDRAGHDSNYCGYAGVLDGIGQAGGPPVLPGVQIADLAGGALTCAIGILSAVLGAKSSGRGSFVDVAMLDGTLALQVVSLASLRMLGTLPPRGEGALTGGLPNYGLYECADGKHLVLGAAEPKFFLRFLAAIGRSDLASLSIGFGEVGAPLRRALEQEIRTKTRDEWDVILRSHDCCASPSLTLEEAFDNEHVRARGVVQLEDGKPVLGLPIHIDGMTARGGRSPELGEHTEEILARVGVRNAEASR